MAARVKMCVAGTSLLLLGLALLILPYEMSGAKAGRKRAEAGGRMLSRGAGLDKVILRGPGSGCMGTLEALHQGEWRTVQVNSGRSSSKMIAHVACRHVGCGSLVHFSYKPSEPVARPSWEVKVSCQGSEVTLEECHYTEPVRTRETSDSRLDITCAESVRLVQQYSDCVGYLAVRAGGVWADVCSSAPLLADKQVMCRELGCGAPVTYTWRRTQSPDQRIKKFFGCRGNESRLQDCSAGEWTADACESPGFLLACQSELTLLLLGCCCYELPTPLRVVGAVGACQGLLEVRHQREWRPLQAVWERQHSQLACAALRCGAATALSRTELDPHRAAWEPNQQCMVELWGQPTPRLCTDWVNAPTSQGVQVTCSEQVPTVRLVPQGTDRCMGRVEVRAGGSWGSLCESSSNQNHWKVVCKELACGFYSYHISLPWNVTAGPVWSIEFGCHGNESSYTNCTATPPSNTCAADEPSVVALGCTERLAAPVMSLSSTSADLDHNGDRRTDAVFGGHAFVISCFAHTVYTIQTFRLQATSEWFLPAVNNSAHFLFQAADRSHQGVYKCSYSLEQAPGFIHHTANHTLHTVKGNPHSLTLHHYMRSSTSPHEVMVYIMSSTSLHEVMVYIMSSTSLHEVMVYIMSSTSPHEVMVYIMSSTSPHEVMVYIMSSTSLHEVMVYIMSSTSLHEVMVYIMFTTSLHEVMVYIMSSTSPHEVMVYIMSSTSPHEVMVYIMSSTSPHEVMVYIMSSTSLHEVMVYIMSSTSLHEVMAYITT
ncbi:Scavenger receptor cysteine-rich type 1 protein M130 [Merluccius polli]|uniref:Scavenger receptor cysteine-rich type 1 protein M130 n=1 Tax=Merluccius polli TaxID=89951 RepID=A0AA47N4V9_MERPO|nr:Scavenger receptor cysteine-rich type 1 protein M130 [Merluccius polli]